MNALLLAASNWVDVWGAGMWRASWQGALAVAVAWAVARWCTFLSPRIVCWAWRLVCIKLLVALFWLQPVHLPLLPAEQTVEADADVAVAPWVGTDAASERLSTGDAAPRVLKSEFGGRFSGLLGILLLLWTAGVFWRIGSSGRQWGFVRELCGSSEPVSSSALQEEYRQEARRLGVLRAPPMGQSPRADGPLLAGVWRPMIIMPDCVEGAFDETERRLMLAHELAHFQRCDLLWNWLLTVVGWLFYFHPFVWVLHRQWSEAQEAACDELLIQEKLARPAEYGRLLLKLATRWPLQANDELVAMGALGAYRNLERRIRAMARVRPSSRGRIGIAVSLFLLTAMIGLVPWRLVAADAEEKISPDARAIRGVWKLVQLDQVNRVPSELELAGWKAGQFKIVVTKNAIEFPDKSSCTYSIDPMSTPKRMFWTTERNGKKNTVPAIYSLEGDSLKICNGREGDESPPSDFDVKKAKNGAFPMCWNLERVKEEAPSKTDVGSDHGTGTAAAVTPATAHPRIVVAEHVLLWDDQIVSWDQVVARLRSMRRAGPLAPTFFFTNAVSNRKEQGWQYWHDRIFELYKDLFQPTGVSFASISPRGGRKFDAIRSADDLRPNPVFARRGRVLAPDGAPAVGAQVVVLPTQDVLGVALEGTRLRDPFDEQWRSTDAAGRFIIYPNEDAFLVAVLHSSGFAILRGPAKGEERTIPLQNWGTLTFASTGDADGQSASISAHPIDADSQWPEFLVYSIKTAGKPIDVPAPPGKVVVNRSLKTQSNSSISTPTETFELKPGEHRTLTVAPATAADRERANAIQKQLDDLRGVKKGR